MARFSGRQSIADDREDCRRRHALPGHRKGQPDKDKWPGRSKEVDQITDAGQAQKQKEGVASAKSIRNPASGILIDSIEEIFGGPEQADQRNARTQSFQILGQEFLPKLLTEAQQENSARRCCDIALKAEKVSQPCDTRAGIPSLVRVVQ
jgi:hypothetical protein